MKNEYQKASVSSDDLPYEKFLKNGPEYLSEAELLAIIIRTGTKGESPLSIAKQILNMKGYEKGLLGLHHIPLSALMELKGIGEVKAVKIKCIAELSKRLCMASTLKNLQISSPSTVADYYMEQLRHLDTEHVILIMLDGKNQIIEEQVLTKGTVNASLLSPRELFLMALEHKAVYLILLHNHPSGDPTPSKQDIHITRQIDELSKLIEIPLLDHIIIGDNKYISLKEKGLL